MNKDEKGAKKRRTKKQPTGDYPNGYARPPENGKIKEGEVRNPHGRNGKPKDIEDFFEKAMARESRVTIDGEVIRMTTVEAYYMKMAAMALNGSVGAARIVQEELHRRRQAGPVPLTAEELAEKEAKKAQREALSGKIVGLLQAKASAKKASGSRTVYRNGKMIKLQPGEPEPDKDQAD